MIYLSVSTETAGLVLYDQVGEGAQSRFVDPGRVHDHGRGHTDRHESDQTNPRRRKWQ